MRSERQRSVAVAQVLAAAALWGVNGVVARALFQRAVDPVHLVQVRMMVGGLALVPVALATASARLHRRVAPRFALYAIALAAVQLTYFEAIATAGVAVAIFLQYTSPLLAAAWEAARSRRLPPRPVLLAIAIATAGSALLVLPRNAGSVPLAGFAWGVAAAVAMAVGTLTAASLRRDSVGSIPLLAYGLVAGSLLFVPVRAPWTAITSIPAGDIFYFLYVAIAATAVPFTLYAAALGSLAGSVTMLVAMLEPVLAAALAWIVLGEALAPVQLAGGALILAAIAVAARLGG